MPNREEDQDEDPGNKLLPWKSRRSRLPRRSFLLLRIYFWIYLLIFHELLLLTFAQVSAASHVVAGNDLF